MIYFVQPTEGGPVKIGYSNDVGARLRQLEYYFGRPLVLLGTMPGDRPEEQAIHERFAHIRLGRTEQFRPEPELMAFLNRPLLVDPNPGAVGAMVPPNGFSTMQVRGSQPWMDWIHEFCAHCRIKSASDLIDQALVAHAKQCGFDEPPPER